MIETPKYPVSHEDRHLVCQEEVEGPLKVIIDQANMHGWGTLEVISAIEDVIKHLRLAYAEDPDPAEDPIDSNEGHAFIHGRGGKETP
ncbi:hypothetical protein [Rhizobium sp. Root483D2]|uniref:hypothetical protein n=1 Tax=Rhizobium sp. Root483D2 TaxID=1736545 RepID=UPI0007126DB4|nr:hypothetical protein [Rhizobium sp. Root483D2]KQY20210.1 hypothetical protein ASD32_07015 [Rhizobium sp. Root483D2]